MKRLNFLILQFLALLVILIIGFIFKDKFLQTWSTNLASIDILRAFLADPVQKDVIYAKLDNPSLGDCYRQRYLGLLMSRLGDKLGQEEYWIAYLECKAQYPLNYVRGAAPRNARLAQKAVEEFPNMVDSWLWLGEALEEKRQWNDAIQAYHQVVTISPYQGLAWCRIGALTRDDNLAGAQVAFLNCCKNGDPGGNGCWYAGQIEEEKGNPAQAIQYYRMSSWIEAHKRADLLENMLQEER